jgi:hypothetical protein
MRQARRLATLVIGFLLLAIGLVLAALPMLPGGVVAILAGLGLLSTELEWARRLRKRMLARGERLLPRPFSRKGKDEASEGGARSGQEARRVRRGRGALTIATVALAVAGTLLAATLIVLTVWHP